MAEEARPITLRELWLKPALASRGPSPYIPTMLSKSRFNPKAGILDFWDEFRKPQPYRWLILAVSSIPFALIMAWAISEKVYLPPERPSITYIPSFAPNRTDEEIIASNIENQKRKDERAARIAEYEEKKREAYKALGAASGFDVEEMERRALEERAAEEAAEAAQNAQVLPKQNQAVPDDAPPKEGAAP